MKNSSRAVENSRGSIGEDEFEFSLNTSPRREEVTDILAPRRGWRPLGLLGWEGPEGGFSSGTQKYQLPLRAEVFNENSNSSSHIEPLLFWTALMLYFMGKLQPASETAIPAFYFFCNFCCSKILHYSNDLLWVAKSTPKQSGFLERRCLIQKLTGLI